MRLGGSISVVMKTLQGGRREASQAVPRSLQQRGQRVEHQRLLWGRKSDIKLRSLFSSTCGKMQASGLTNSFFTSMHFQLGSVPLVLSRLHGLQPPGFLSSPAPGACYLGPNSASWLFASLIPPHPLKAWPMWQMAAAWIPWALSKQLCRWQCLLALSLGSPYSHLEGRKSWMAVTFLLL